MVQKKLREVSLARGKTSSLDRAEHVEMLTYLASVAKGPVQVRGLHFLSARLVCGVWGAGLPGLREWAMLAYQAAVATGRGRRGEG